MLTYKDRARVHKVRRCQDKIQELLQYIKDLQAECNHPLLEKRYGSNTGNYDPHNDCYWTDYFCPVCGKRWTEEQSRYNDGAVEVKDWKCQMLTDDQLRQS
jgi:hypothetical protein